MTLRIELSTELEVRLASEARQKGIPVEKLTLELLDRHLPKGRRAELSSLLRSWIDDADPEEQRETGKLLVQALDEDRLSDRKLFPSALQGVTW